MSRCQICDQKAMNCDCTQTEREQFEDIDDLRDEIENLQSEIKQLQDDNLQLRDKLSQSLIETAELLEERITARKAKPKPWAMAEDMGRKNG